MAVRELNDFGVGDLNGTAIMETLNKAYKGKAEITLSNYDNDLAPVVKIGSVFDNNGAIFLVETADETPSGYSGITVSTEFYLYYDESAGAFIYSNTAPVWNDALQGWYNGNDRAFFSMYKDSGGTLYEDKIILISQSRRQTKDVSILNLTLPYGKSPESSYTGAGTYGGLYDALTAYIKSNGDKILMTGGYATGAVYAFVSHAERISSTTIRLYTITAGSYSAQDITSGLVTVRDFSVAW